MVMIPSETDQIKLQALLGAEISRKSPELAQNVLNSNAYRLNFLESLPIKSSMFEEYKKRLRGKGQIQGVKDLSEFSKLVIACNRERVLPESLD